MEQKVCRVWTRTAATVFGARVWPATGAAHLPPGADRDLRGPHVALILRQLHRDPAPGQGDRLPAAPGPVQLLEPHPHSETRVRSTAARTQAGHSITLPRRSGLWLACKYCSSCLCCLSVINNYNNVHVGSYSNSFQKETWKQTMFHTYGDMLETPILMWTLLVTMVLWGQTYVLQHISRKL